MWFNELARGKKRGAERGVIRWKGGPRQRMKVPKFQPKKKTVEPDGMKVHVGIHGKRNWGKLVLGKAMEGGWWPMKPGPK